MNPNEPESNNPNNPFGENNEPAPENTTPEQIPVSDGTVPSDSGNADTDSSPSTDLTEALKDEPTNTANSFPVADDTPVAPIGGPAIVPQKSKKKKVIVFIAMAFLVAGLATAGYFVGQSLQQAAAPASNETDSQTTEETTDTTPVETATDVETDIDTRQEDIDALTDEAFSDEPISDDTLNAAE